MAVGPVDLFSLAFRHNEWLAARQAAIAGNIANANTPGFKALDLESFDAVLNSSRLSMARSQPGHLRPAADNMPTADVRSEQPWEVLHSGNTVSLEQELLKAGEVSRSYRLNTSIAKSFHRMILASAKV